MSVPDIDPLASPMLRDELDGLKLALDGESMRPHLQRALLGSAEGAWTIESCKAGKAIYVGDVCVLRYQLELEGGEGESCSRLVGGRLFSSHDASAADLHDRLVPLAEMARGRPELLPFSAPVAALEAVPIVVYAWPLDADLPSLLDATDPQRMLVVVQEMLPGSLGQNILFEDCRIELAHYPRRDRCVLRYKLEARDRVSGRSAKHTVYGKVGADDWMRTGRIMTALRERVLAGNGQYNFQVPRFLGFRPDLRLGLVEEVPGVPRVAQLLKARYASPSATDAALTLEGAVAICARIASALHASDVDVDEVRTWEDDLAALSPGLATVSRHSPRLAGRLDECVARVKERAAAVEPLPLSPSHGDYTDSQVLFEGASAGLVDFDTMCLAEPALDLGQFCAYLRVAARKAERAYPSIPPGLGNELCEQFLGAYLESANARTRQGEQLRERLWMYDAISLLRMAVRSWHQLKAQRLMSVLSVLEERMA